MSTPPVLHDPHVWSNLVDAVQPASILVAIHWRLGDLQARLTPEDVWQETLLRAWQAQREFEWQGTASFRRWLMRIAENCIETIRAHEHAQKRDLGRTVPLSLPRAGADGTRATEPWGSTTPSRVAAERERAQAMQRALAALPDELREVVRLRLFEDLPILDIAARLGLGESGVRHRVRKGVELFHQRLRAAQAATDAATGDASAGSSC